MSIGGPHEVLPPHGQPPIEIARALFERFAHEIEHNSGTEARNDFERSEHSAPPATVAP